MKTLLLFSLLLLSAVAGFGQSTTYYYNNGNTVYYYPPAIDVPSVTKEVPTDVFDCGFIANSYNSEKRPYAAFDCVVRTETKEVCSDSDRVLLHSQDGKGHCVLFSAIPGGYSGIGTTTYAECCTGYTTSVTPTILSGTTSLSYVTTDGPTKTTTNTTNTKNKEGKDGNSKEVK